jgi:acetylglutamate kinase
MTSKQSEKLYVIKIGGNIIDDPAKLTSFLKTFATIKERKILVHGGGKIATQIGEKLGVESKYLNGRRITDDHTIDLVTMVYGGLINKKIVAQLQSMQCNAIGLTGADANLIPASKRKVEGVDFGWVGDINYADVQERPWNVFLQNNMVPVAAPLTHDTEGHILNTNADTIAFVISVALSKLYEVILIYCFEKKGVLSEISDDSSVISIINKQTFKELLEQKKIAEGILPKIENALSAVEFGVSRIIIGSADDLLTNTSNNPIGTIINK